MWCYVFIFSNFTCIQAFLHYFQAMRALGALTLVSLIICLEYLHGQSSISLAP